MLVCTDGGLAYGRFGGNLLGLGPWRRQRNFALVDMVRSALDAAVAGQQAKRHVSSCSHDSLLKKLSASLLDTRTMSISDLSARRPQNEVGSMPSAVKCYLEVSRG